MGGRNRLWQCPQRNEVAILPFNSRGPYVAGVDIMNQSQVQCKNCDHQVQSREVLRTDLYERESGRAYVYVKFRCAHCKRMGQLFIPEHKWDWHWLEPARDEMNDAERDRLTEAGPITDGELLDFHNWLKSAARWSDIKRDGKAGPPPRETPGSGPQAKPGGSAQPPLEKGGKGNNRPDDLKGG